jgi:hypothetical protein
MGLAVISGEHIEDLSMGAGNGPMISKRTIADSVIESSTMGTVALL